MKWVVALLLLASCAPATWDDLRAEGEAETRKLAQILHRVDTKEQLQKELPKIRRSYVKIAELVVEIRKKGEEFSSLEEREPSESSDALFSELARLYEMPGCRELIESAQSEAIYRLMN